MTGDQMIQQKVGNHLRLWILEAFDLGDKLPVEKDTLLVSDGMHSHNRVDRVRRGFPNETAGHLCVGDHLGRRVNCSQFIDEGLESG